MKIYFDVSTLNPDKVTGVGVYMLELVKRFAEKPEVRLQPVVKISRFKNRNKIQSLLGNLKCDLLFPWKLAEKKSLYHGPDFKVNVLGSIPRIVTVHDMVVFEQKYNAPEFYEKGIADLTKLLSSDLDAVIVNSEFTKSEVLKYFPRLENKIFVTLLGCDRENSQPVPSRLNLPEKYILFLGTLETRKNVVGVIKAFEMLKSQSEVSHKLVLAGTWGFGADEIKRTLETSPVKEDIIHLNYIPNDEIINLYKNASVFFFPSHYEGFGIPVLEAMALGCPVVTSDAGALKEICGEAALMAPASDFRALSGLLLKVLGSPEVREHLKKAGLKRAQKFTWENCAQETLKVYKKVLR